MVLDMDARASVTPLNLIVAFLPYMPDLTQAVNYVIMTSCSMGQEMLESKGSILQILA